jgi:hypothetical protein
MTFDGMPTVPQVPPIPSSMEAFMRPLADTEEVMANVSGEGTLGRKGHSAIDNTDSGFQLSAGVHLFGPPPTRVNQGLRND